MKIAFFRDGPLIPQFTGGAVRFYNILKNFALANDTILFQCNRDWVDAENYDNEPFKTYFLPESEFYSYKNIVNLILQEGVTALWFDCPEIFLSVGYKIKKAHPEIMLIYDANDNITELYKRLKKQQKDIELMNFYESLVADLADKIYCVSVRNLEYFKKMGANAQLLENGTNIAPITHSSRRDVCFVGNNYYKPNENAIKIIKDIIAPKILSLDQDIKIFIVGGTPEYLMQNAPSNMVFLGQIKNLDKFYENILIGICPLMEGSGTRIKILEWMAHNIPVISTSLGAEGLDVENNKNIIIEDYLELFADKMFMLYNDKTLIDNLCHNAYQLVKEHYTWKKIVEKIIV